MADEREDEIIWTLEESGQYSASSAYNIQFAGQISLQFSKIDMESAGTAEMQNVPMAAPTEQTMDCSPPTTTWLPKQLLLYTMREEPKDCNTTVY